MVNARLSFWMDSGTHRFMISSALNPIFFIPLSSPSNYARKMSLDALHGLAFGFILLQFMRV